jgi:hypothetical protein
VATREFGFAVALRLAGVALFGIAALGQAIAQQGPSPPQQGAGATAADDNNGLDFTRPQRLFQLRAIYETTPGNGVVPGTIRTVTRDVAVLRVDLPVELAPQWSLVLRGDLPAVAKNPVTSDNPAGDYLYGLGDADFQAAVIHQIDARWAAGAGARIIAPTGSDDLASGKWQVMPLLGARYALPELSTGSYVQALVRYDVSFAGDPSKNNISNLQFAPMLNIGLPNRWFFTFYPSPDIRVNYGDPITGQTGRLFLPLELMLGRSLTKDVTVSLEVGVPIVKDYPVYDFKSVMRLNMKF